MKPRRPSHIPPLGEECLRVLSRLGLGDYISLGGAFGLLHYLDYRPTHDVDAWWEPGAKSEHRKAVVDAIDSLLRQHGETRLREWGDVTSVELVSGPHEGFSFQVADRSVRLEDPQPAGWIDIRLDSFVDLVAGKMVALVERGAPRDFLDIYSLCTAELLCPQDAWQIWGRRSREAGTDADLERARLAVHWHLKRIERYRPLDSIEDSGQREEAESARRWYREELLDG